MKDEKILLNEIDSIYQKLIFMSKTDRDGIYWETIESNSNAISTSIYSGVSGIILFLTEYYKLRKNPNVLELIERSSFWLANKSNAISNNNSFYTGQVGNLYTLFKVGTLLNINKLSETYVKHLDSLIDYKNYSRNNCDFLNGLSGTTLGLLHIYSETRDLKIRQIIDNLLNHIIKNVELSDFGLSWNKNRNAIRNLCGFSHGASGIGFVFLEMGNFFGNDLFFHIAQRAFDYEDNYYNKNLFNWPDFRKIISNEPTKMAFVENYQKGNLNFFTTPNYMNAWCHGAPGILLARIRSDEVLSSNKYKEFILRNIEVPKHKSFSLLTETLCHGKLGNSAVHMEMYRTYGERQYWELFKSACLQTIKSKDETGNYKSGNKDIKSQDLSLFNGLAGIGYSYIQAINPSTPSVLLPKVKASSIDEKLASFDMANFSKTLFAKYFSNTQRVLNGSDTKISFSNSIIFKIDDIVNFKDDINKDVQFIYKLERRKYELSDNISSYSLLNTMSIVNKFLFEKYLEGNEIGKYSFLLNPLVEFSFYEEKNMFFLIYPDITEFKLVKIDRATHEFLKYLNTPVKSELLQRKYDELKDGYAIELYNDLKDFLVRLVNLNLIKIQYEM